MRHSVAVALAIGLLVASLTPAPPLASAAPGVVHETVGGDSGARSVRSAPVGAEMTSAPGEEAPAIPPLSGGGNVLWVDQNHLAAVAQNLAITGDGAYVVGGWWLNNSRVSLYATNGTGVPAWTFPISSSFFIPVDAAGDGSVITGTGRQDLLYAWTAASNVPVCSETHPAGTEGIAAFTPDIGGQFAGSAMMGTTTSFTHAHTAPGCNDLFNVSLSGVVQGGRYAADGDWVAVNSRAAVDVYDSQTGVLRGSVAIPGETEATVGVSRDGNILAIGGFSRLLRVHQWDGSQYVPLWGHVIPSITWITAVDVSDDGSTVMAGTWVFTTPDLGRVVMYDVASGPTPLWTNSDFGDYVDSVELNADGSRGIAGSWGRLNGTFGHVIAVFDRASPVPVFAVEDDEIPGVGSCMVVDISNDGSRAAGGGKAVHAREFGNGGFTLALDIPGVTQITQEPLASPEIGRLALGQSRPNPMNRSTEIPYALSGPAAVRLSIFNGAGRAVRVLDLGMQGAGSHFAPWDGRDLAGGRVPSGVYFYRMETAAGSAIRAAATRQLVVME